MKTQHTRAKRLENIGFKKYGEWKIEGGMLKCDLVDDSAVENVLYAFISAGEVLYIGKTVRSLKKRMYNYQKPAKTQLTSYRCNEKIITTVSGGKPIEVYALPDNGLLHYGGFHVNLAAGLEDNLIKELQPVWNITGL
jgi:hypothetical protein